jgi:transcriptional regulator with XRE-family HTH domain
MLNREYNQFGTMLIEAIKKINENRKYNRKITLTELGIASGIDMTLLCRYFHGGKRPSLHTVIRLLTTLPIDSATATALIRCAGYDITYDNYPYNIAYRSLIEERNLTIDEINDIIRPFGPEIVKLISRS